MTMMATEKKSTQPVTSARPHAGACGDSCDPTHDDIARRAYDIYVKTGWKQGQCKQNWQQAEQSLHDQRAQALHSPQHSAVGASPAPSTR